MSFPTEPWIFLRAGKKFWLLPIFVKMGLFGGLAVPGQGSAVAPFIYTIFRSIRRRARPQRFRLLSRQRRHVDRGRTHRHRLRLRAGRHHQETPPSGSQPLHNTYRFRASPLRKRSLCQALTESGWFRGGLMANQPSLSWSIDRTFLTAAFARSISPLSSRNSLPTFFFKNSSFF